MEAVLIIGLVIYLIVGLLITFFLDMAEWDLVSLDMSPIATTKTEKLLGYLIACLLWMPLFIILLTILITNNEKDSDSSE